MMETEASEVLRRHLTNAVRELSGRDDIHVVHGVVVCEVFTGMGRGALHQASTDMNPWTLLGLADAARESAVAMLHHDYDHHTDRSYPDETE